MLNEKKKNCAHNLTYMPNLTEGESRCFFPDVNIILNLRCDLYNVKMLMIYIDCV